MTKGAVTRRIVLAGSFMLPASFVFGQAAATLSAREAFEQAQAKRILLIDIRNAQEWADTGLPQGALPLDVDAPAFEVRIAGLRLDNPGKRIVLIDRTGAQAVAVAQKLAGRGWRDLAGVRGRHARARRLAVREAAGDGISLAPFSPCGRRCRQADEGSRDLCRHCERSEAIQRDRMKRLTSPLGLLRR